MEYFLISNNEYVYNKYPEDTIYFNDGTYMDVLKYARDKIHAGHKLLTHPLSGSIKPNETPYKTVMLSKDKGDLCNNSLRVIEDSIQTAEKFQKIAKTPNWDEEILDDFRVIDLDLIENIFK